MTRTCRVSPAVEYLLVGLQFGVIALLLWSAVQAPMPSPRSVQLAVVVALGVAGVLVGALALWSNRPGNFNIRPTPKALGRLVTSGIYRRIRHPMYSAVLLFALSVFALVPDGHSLGLVLALFVVLVLKASIEEALMLAQHPGYADYLARTKRFIPFLL